MSALSLGPEDALTLLHAEVCAGRDLQALLEPSNLASLARQWQSLSEEAQVPLRELLAALAAQVQRPDCRWETRAAVHVQACLLSTCKLARYCYQAAMHTEPHCLCLLGCN
jgi:hypothetical protein